MIELEPDAIRVFEQHRIVAGHEIVLARDADNPRIRTLQKQIKVVHVLAAARPKTQMMQANPV